MRKWLYNNPWIWIALFLGSVVAASMVVVVIAEINKPEIVKAQKEPAVSSLEIVPSCQSV